MTLTLTFTLIMSLRNNTSFLKVNIINSILHLQKEMRGLSQDRSFHDKLIAMGFVHKLARIQNWGSATSWHCSSYLQNLQGSVEK